MNFEAALKSAFLTDFALNQKKLFKSSVLVQAFQTETMPFENNVRITIICPPRNSREGTQFFENRF